MDRRGPYILTRPDGRPWFTEANDKELGKQWSAHIIACGLRPDEYAERPLPAAQLPRVLQCRILQSCPSRCEAAKTNGLYLHTLSGISSYLLYFGAIAKIRAIDGMQ